MNFDLEKAPITKKFVEDLTIILNDLKGEGCQKLIKYKKFNELEDLLSEKYPLFMMNNYTLVMAFVDKSIDNFTILNKMINLKILIETNQIGKEEADNIMHELLNEIYIYKKYGSKENFIKELEKNHK